MARGGSRSRSPRQAAVVTGRAALLAQLGGAQNGAEKPSSPQEQDAIIQKVRDSLEALCALKRIPESHGLLHATRVLAHAEQAVAEASPALAPARALAVRLAALLHDADDRKYFEKVPGEEGFPNAQRLMQEANVAPDVVQDVLRMIELVSCSKNGNSVPEEAVQQPELLWPRWADRLEATGEIGVVRCWQYNGETNAPFACECTPRPTTEAEVWALATEERFQEYQRSGGRSMSMMDHYYDKLLRVARPDFRCVQNTYLEAEMQRRAEPLVEVCLAYGRTGQVPEDLIREMDARVRSQEEGTVAPQ